MDNVKFTFFSHIFRSKISTAGCIKLTIFTMLYGISYGVLFYYKEVLVDPRDAMYSHDSPVGMGLIIMRVIGKYIISLDHVD